MCSVYALKRIVLLFVAFEIRRLFFSWSQSSEDYIWSFTFYKFQRRSLPKVLVKGWLLVLMTALRAGYNRLPHMRSAVPLVQSSTRFSVQWFKHSLFTVFLAHSTICTQMFDCVSDRHLIVPIYAVNSSATLSCLVLLFTSLHVFNTVACFVRSKWFPSSCW